jgi:hypothetical protein
MSGQELLVGRDGGFNLLPADRKPLTFRVRSLPLQRGFIGYRRQYLERYGFLISVESRTLFGSEVAHQAVVRDDIFEISVTRLSLIELRLVVARRDFGPKPVRPALPSKHAIQLSVGARLHNRIDEGARVRGALGGGFTGQAASGCPNGLVRHWG